MAKILLERGDVVVRVGCLERVVLGERPRRVPLREVVGVDPHPKLPDMMLYWMARPELWMSGVTCYEGQLIPTTRNPLGTLAITLSGEEGRIFVELDDETPEHAAARIQAGMDGAWRNAEGGNDVAARTDHSPGAGPPSVGGERVGTALMVLGGVTLATGAVFLSSGLAPSPLLFGVGLACAIGGVIGRTVATSR